MHRLTTERRERSVLEASDLFQRDWYLARYPRVAAAGIDPIVHYLRYGAQEGRDPSPRFSTVGYLRRFPDVSGSGLNPLVHFVLIGQAEGRDPRGLDGANDLVRYFRGNEGRLIHKWVHYFDIYDRHLARFRGKEVVVLEFGVSHGGSLEMWRDYFGPMARIYGVDIDPRCKAVEGDRISVLIGDQGDRGFLRSLHDQVGTIDVVIDDGGHTMSQQIATFEVMYPGIATDGVFLVEDLHTSYWEEFGGAYLRPGTFIEYAKGLLDQLNAWHSRDSALVVDGFTRTTRSVHWYDSVIVFEKGTVEQPRSDFTGSPSF